MKAKLVLNKDFVISPVDPRLYGGFIEHLGRAVYEGIYEPGHPRADADGFREDVLELVQGLDMPVTRYPGGNFVSGYNWEDGVGPKDQRPVRAELAWKAMEPNTFGTNEFIDWCKKAKTEPMLAVNLGTRGPEEARNYLEYCNFAGGTYWSDLRKAHGYEAPHGVKLWCLGNEMDGLWQIGHKTAKEYARIAEETAKVMKWTDPSIELIACGSSFPGMKEYGKYELETLTACLDHVNYISAHVYYNNTKDDTPHFLSKPDEMDAQIKALAAFCDTASAIRRSKKRIDISFDEWNVWFHSGEQDRKVPEWTVARPILEDVYTMEDALVVGGMLMAMLRNADRVKIGCIAQTVNVIAPIMTARMGPAWAQTIYYPFQQASRWGRGTSLQPVVSSPTYKNGDGVDVNTLDAAAVLSEDQRFLTVFAVNRSLDQELELSVELGGLSIDAVDEYQVMCDRDLKAVNTAADPQRVTPSNSPEAQVKGSTLTAKLPAASWNVMRLRLA